MVIRHLVLFAREPARQAREKGFGALPDASLLFSKFAGGWAEAARAAGATLVISTPPEDVVGWRRVSALAGARPLWIAQQGRTFGERLRHTAATAASFGGCAVLVGGDVEPSADLAAAFEALEAGADAVLAPAGDGGISLIGLLASDLDLVARIDRRRRNVFTTLRDSLERRGRRIAVLGSVPDIDGRTALRGLVRGEVSSAEILRLGRRVLAAAHIASPRRLASFFERAASPLPGLRGPPRAA